MSAMREAYPDIKARKHYWLGTLEIPEQQNYEYGHGGCDSPHLLPRTTFYGVNLRPLVLGRSNGDAPHALSHQDSYLSPLARPPSTSRPKVKRCIHRFHRRIRFGRDSPAPIPREAVSRELVTCGVSPVLERANSLAELPRRDTRELFEITILYNQIIAARSSRWLV